MSSGNNYLDQVLDQTKKIDKLAAKRATFREFAQWKTSFKLLSPSLMSAVKSDPTIAC